MLDIERQHEAIPQRRPTAVEQLLAASPEEKDVLIERAERVIYETAGLRELGVKALDLDHWDDIQKSHNWMFRFSSTKDNPVTAWINFNPNTKTFNLVSYPSQFNNSEPNIRVSDFSPELMTSALPYVINQCRTLTEDSEDVLVSPSELPPAKEVPPYPRIWLITGDQKWLEKTGKVFSRLQYSTEEIVVTKPGRETFDRLYARTFSQDPEVICLGCNFIGNMRLYQDVGTRYFPASFKLASVGKDEYRADTTRALLSKNGLYHFDDILPRSADEINLAESFQTALDLSVYKWKALLKRFT